MPDTNGSYMKVDFAALGQTIDDLNRAATHMNERLADLERQAAPMVALWQGAARDAYDQRQATWRKAAEELNTILAGIKTAVQQSSTEYQATESQVAGTFR